MSSPTPSLVYGIDAWSASRAQKTGVEMYAFQLIQAMKHHALSPGERVVLYSPEPLTGALAQLPAGWESRVVAWPGQKRLPGWMQIRLSWELAIRPPSVFFVPAQGIPRRIPGRFYPIVTTVHDVAFLSHPELYPPRMRRRIYGHTVRALRRAQSVLTVSESAKKEIELFFPEVIHRVRAIHLASSLSLSKTFSREAIETVLRRYRLSNHYFLFIGRLDKKKNIETLVRAFDRWKSTRGSGDPFELVLVGAPGFGFAEIEAWIRSSAYASAFRILGYLPEKDVEVLLSAATAFVFPSWAEGFGIPLVDAMCAGVPIIASDIPVHREVLQEAAWFVKPGDLAGWSQALQIATGEKEAHEKMVASGKDRAQAFDWRATAEQTWEALRGMIH